MIWQLYQRIRYHFRLKRRLRGIRLPAEWQKAHPDDLARWR